MGLMLDKVHEVAKIPGRQETRIVKINPLVRIKGGGELTPPLFLQGGRVYAENGQEIVDRPDWFEEELAKLTEATKEQVGFSAAPPAPAVSMRTCTTCGAEVAKKQWGLHQANHKRKLVGRPAGG